jgi:hypothetical protein
METPTFRRLYEAALRRGLSPNNAYGRALAVMSFLSVVARHDKTGRTLPFASSTYKRRLIELRQAAIAPVAGPSELARLGRDLGVSDADSLARLLWALNVDPARRLERVRATWAALIAQAQAIIETEATEPAGSALLEKSVETLEQMAERARAEAAGWFTIERRDEKGFVLLRAIAPDGYEVESAKARSEDAASLILAHKLGIVDTRWAELDPESAARFKAEAHEIPVRDGVIVSW